MGLRRTMQGTKWMQKISLKMSRTKLLKGVLGIGCFEAICNTSTYQILLKEAEVQTTTDKSNLTTSLIRIYI